MTSQSLETDNASNRFASELKWASYYLIYAIAAAIVFTIIRSFTHNEFLNDSLGVWVYNLVAFIYCTFQCIKEKKNKSFLSKLSALPAIITIYFMYLTLLMNSSVFIIPKKEIEIQTSQNDLVEFENNLFNDMINFLKRKLSSN
jgi:hypothetical protein